MYTDLIIQLKNAQAAGKKSLKVRFTKMDQAVAELLRQRGFLESVEVKGRSYKKMLELHTDPDRRIEGARWLSTPSLRRFGSYRDFRRVKSGYGMLVVSTPQGVMDGERARREKVGGQLLFEIW